MEYKRPKNDLRFRQELSIEYSEEDFIEDLETKIKVPHRFSYIEYIPTDLTKEINDINYQFDRTKLTDELKFKQSKFLDLKHRCIRMAENLNENLRSFLSQYSDINNLHEKDTLYKLDFMKLRDRFSEIVKKDQQFGHIDLLNSNPNKKNLTKTFTEFIEDRNIYTHGHLHICLNDGLILITYVDKKYNNHACCIVDGEIIQSFYTTYKTLNETVSKMIQHQALKK